MPGSTLRRLNPLVFYLNVACQAGLVLKHKPSPNRLDGDRLLYGRMEVYSTPDKENILKTT
jgi:hypothetical protein